jgi:hypothetical protein
MPPAGSPNSAAVPRLNQPQRKVYSLAASTLLSWHVVGEVLLAELRQHHLLSAPVPESPA